MIKFFLIGLIFFVAGASCCQLLDNTVPCQYTDITTPEVIMQSGVWMIHDQTQDVKYVFGNIREMVGAFTSTQTLKDAPVKVTLPIPQTSLNQLRSMAIMSGLSKLYTAINQAS